MSGDNYPPGVTASSLPGFNDVDVTVPLQCQASALYVGAQGVADAVDAGLQAIRDALGDEAFVAVRYQVQDAMRHALAGHWERADVIDSGELCGFDGEAEGTRSGTVVRVSCPRCNSDHEIEQD